MIFFAHRCFEMCTPQDLQTKSQDSVRHFVKFLDFGPLPKTVPLLLPFRTSHFFCWEMGRRDSGQFTCSVLAEIAGALGSLQDSGVSAKRGASGSNCAVTLVASG